MSSGLSLRPRPHTLARSRRRSLRLRQLGGWALVLLVALLTAGCANDEERIAEFIARGEDYVASGADEEAIIEYKNVLQLDPDNPDAHEALSLAFLRVQKPADAYWEMSETVRIDPEKLPPRATRDEPHCRWRIRRIGWDR